MIFQAVFYYMKNFFSILALSFLTVISVMAQLNTLPSGYYRVQNATTARYACLYDNKGYVDKVATSIDVGGIRTYHDFSRVVSDPASIIFFTKSTSGYQLSAQGTKTSDFLGNYYLQLKYNGTTYQAYGEQSGYQIYLSDEMYNSEKSQPGVMNYDAIKDSMGYMQSNGASNKYWKIQPVSASTGNYFGFSPTMQVGLDYYQSFYAVFPFSKSSIDLQAFYVGKRNDDKAVAEMDEIMGLEFPGATPMIIKTTTQDPSQNRVNVLTTSSASVSGNLLKGVYFCSTDNLLPWYDQLAGNHENYVLNNPATMRVFAVDNGELVLKKVTWKYIPRNSFYMQVPSTAPDVYRLLPPDAYATSISTVSINNRAANLVYNLSGQLISEQGTVGLRAGLYVQNGRKIVVN